MKKILYTDFVDTGSLIEKMLENKDLQRAIKRSNLYKFWEKAVGEKLAANSKPYSITSSGTMIIACKNNIAAQELLLKKFQILNKLNPYLKSLKMNVKDLKFDAKKWIEET